MESMFKPVDSEIVQKYGVTGFMYTEYPHKSQWNQSFGQEGFTKALLRLKEDDPEAPVLLYVHLPYCEQLCWFCTCHVFISKKYERVRSFLDLLEKEVALLEAAFDSLGWRPNIKEVHLGGGSPTYLSEEDFVELKSCLETICDFGQLGELAMEIDPRRVDVKRMLFYADQGVSRISFGIQDFDLLVQEAVNRVQPPDLIENLLTSQVRKRFTSTNFDILCGLPRQTPDTIRRTMERAAAMKPDRICFNYLHYTPKTTPHQQMMPEKEIPDFNQRKEIFQAGMATLLSNGYLRTGYDHFSRPYDRVAVAQKKGDMTWNSFGYTPGDCVNILGIGPHSYSRIGENFYSQNHYEIKSYRDSLNDGCLPIYRGLELSVEDALRRDLIQTLRSYFEIDISKYASEYEIEFESYFEPEIKALMNFEADGLVRVTAGKIIVTDLGKLFVNLICRVFDSYYVDDLSNRDFFKYNAAGTPS